jgi:hypothetical protein
MPSSCTVLADFTRGTSKIILSMVKDSSSYQTVYMSVILLITNLKAEDHFIGTMVKHIRVSFWEV